MTKIFDWDKYNILASEAGIGFFDDHGACSNCVNDLTETFPEEHPCTCKEEEEKQRVIIETCGGGV